jgi:mannose-6-phosphate isomerase-like protein (cupin superfamily)
VSGPPLRQWFEDEGRDKPPHIGDTPADLTQGEGPGPVWGLASADLNATLLAWPAGEGLAEQVNEERDVLLIVVGGSGTVWLEGVEHAVHAPQAVLIEKGQRFRVSAGNAGIRYVSVHRRRGPLTVAPLT